MKNLRSGLILLWSRTAGTLHPSTLPPLARHSYTLELGSIFCFSIALACVEGGVVSVFAKQSFAEAAPLPLLNLAVAILLESGLSFLGLGVPPPEPDLGLMIAEGRGFIVMAPWISGFPGLALVVIIVGLNLFGDGLRDALDPKAQIS